MLAVWGGSYLYGCLIALSAPGAPVEFSYLSKGGPLTFHADSYAVNLQRGTVRLERPVLLDPLSSTIAQADYAEATGLQLASLGQTPINVRVKTLRADLVRLKNGDFAFQQYLPPSNNKAGQTAFHVEIDGAAVTYIDLTGPRSWRQRAVARLVTVDGLGDNWVASASPDMPGIGTADAEVRGLSQEGILIRLNSKQLNLAGVLNHFRETPDSKRAPFVRDLSAQTLTARGPLELFVPSKSGLQIQSEIDVVGTGVRYADWASASDASFKGFFNQTGVNGVLKATAPGIKAAFEGSLSWAGRTTLGGRLNADLASLAVLPVRVRKQIPAGLRLSGGHYAGWLAYDPTAGLQATGAASAASLDYRKVAVAGLAGTVDLVGHRLLAHLDRASWSGAAIQGSVSLDRASKAIQGDLKASNVSLGAVTQQAKIKGIQGVGTATAIVSGTLDHPLATLMASGQGAYRRPQTGKSYAGSFEASGSYGAGAVTLSRLALTGQFGTVVAIGSVDTIHRVLAVNLIGRGLTLQAFSPDFEGIAAFEGRLVGKLDNPTLTGRTEVYGATYSGQSVPVIVANVFATKDSVRAENLRAVKGATEATGRLALALKSHALVGSLSAIGVQLADLTNQALGGTLNVKDALVSGTLSQPKLAAMVTGEHLVAKGVEIETMKADLRLSGNRLVLTDLLATSGKGALTGSGLYDIKSHSGQASFSGKDLAIENVVIDAARAGVTGTLAGSADVKIRGGVLASATGSGAVKNVVVNGTPLGNGSWAANTAGDFVHASAHIGEIDRFAEVPAATYNTKTGDLTGDALLYNIRAGDLYQASQRYLTKLTPAARDRLSTVEGDINAKVSFSGPAHTPNIDLSLLTVENIKYQGEDFGALTGTVSRVGSVWSIPNLQWALNWTDVQNKAQATKFNLRGTVDEKGDVNLDGDLSNLALDKLDAFDPSLANIIGTADLNFVAKGPSRSPVINASLQYGRSANLPAGEQQKLDFGLLLDSITISESSHDAAGRLVGGIVASGTLNYRGIAGNVTAQIPLKYPFEILQDQPLTAEVKLPDRDLSTLTDFYGGIDSKKTTGTMSGFVRISGTPKDLSADGNIHAMASVFALNGFDTALNNADLTLGFNQDSVNFSARGDGSRGGNFSANASTKLQDFGELLKLIAAGSTRQILESPISGAIALNGFRLVQKGKEGSLDMAASSALTLSGPLRAPTIAGNATFSGANVVLPPLPAGTGEQTIYSVDPRFDIKFAIADAAKLKSSAASLDLSGQGQLLGRLSQPDLQANLAVEAGQIRLPTARVTIQPGGTMNIIYKVGSAGDTDARLDVNLEGTTGLTAAGSSGQVQRYEITLGVRGNLLQEGGLNLTASSDPPDLNQDQILALLGQTQILTSLGTQSSRSDIEHSLTQALAGYAVPILLEPLTAGVATSLGLDYLQIEYDPFDLASVAFAKSLGKGVILQGRRQLSQPRVDTPQHFDLRLSYRLPSHNRLLSRTTFSIGTDQDHPYKLAVEYNVRF